MVAIDGCAMSVVDGAGRCRNRTMGVGTTSPTDVVAAADEWGWDVMSAFDSSIKLQYQREGCGLTVIVVGDKSTLRVGVDD